MRATNCATPRKRYSVYVLWSWVTPTVSAAVRECSRLGHRSGDLMPSLISLGKTACSRLGHRSGDLMPSLISLGKTAGDRCFGNSSLVLMSRTMRSDLLRYASKKIFSLCIMVVGCTHGLGGSKGCSRLGHRSGDLMPSLISLAAASVTARAT